MSHLNSVLSIGRILLGVGGAVALAGCAAQVQSEGASLAPGSALPPPVDASAVRAAPGGYTLSADEAKLDCPRMTGRMHIKIANMRATASGPGSSNASRTMQSIAAPVFGGTQRGADPASDLQRERAVLEAFNRRLVEKKCKPVDLDAALRGEAAAAASKAGKKG